MTTLYKADHSPESIMTAFVKPWSAASSLPLSLAFARVSVIEKLKSDHNYDDIQVVMKNKST